MRVCLCGCDENAHMGKPQGCVNHGFHEFEKKRNVGKWVNNSRYPQAPAKIYDEDTK